jgi:hypothetical protein
VLQLSKEMVHECMDAGIELIHILQTHASVLVPPCRRCISLRWLPRIFSHPHGMRHCGSWAI